MKDNGVSKTIILQLNEASENTFDNVYKEENVIVKKKNSNRKI